jgi:hypothetical protein
MYPDKRLLLKMKKYFVVFLFLGLFAFSYKQPSYTLTLAKKWESDTLFKVPESVLYDPLRNVIYVANINGKSGEKDGNGFISRLLPDGRIEELEWISGLDAPKGMGLYQDKLYVADLTAVVVIDLKNGKIEKRIEVPGASFLNDLTIDTDGHVYISDSQTLRVYRLTDDIPRVWKEHTEWQKPNGLLALEGALHLIDMNNGKLYELSYKNGGIRTLATAIPSGDGIVAIGKDEYLISNWNGEILHVHKGNVHKILDTKAEKKQAADIWYIPSERLLLVPTFFANTVAAYTLEPVIQD